MTDTDAGRALLAEYDDPEAPIYPPRESDIDAIEREAKQQERERIRAAVGYDVWITAKDLGWDSEPVLSRANLDRILAEPSDD